MTEPVTYYGLEDFDNIKKGNFECELDDDVTKIINEIANLVSAPEYNKTPQFKKGKDQEWENKTKFKVTEIVKDKGSIDNIRKFLNKISSNNYDNYSALIIEELRSIQDDKTILHELCNSIFNIVSGNIYYSKIYAKLYMLLISEFDVFNKKLESKLIDFHKILSIFESCNPNVDYDKFCKINKENEKRRSLVSFYVELSKLKIVESKKIVDMIFIVQNQIMEKIEEEDSKYIVEECSEILFILIDNDILSLLEDPVCISNIKKYINTVIAFKASDKPSLTSKSIFKHMDISDKLN